MKAYGKIELLGEGPERRIHWVTQHFLAVIRVRSQKTALHSKCLAREAHFRHRILDGLHWQHRDAK